MDRRAWQVTIPGVAKSQTRLKQLSTACDFLAGVGEVTAVWAFWFQVRSLCAWLSLKLPSSTWWGP